LSINKSFRRLVSLVALASVLLVTAGCGQNAPQPVAQPTFTFDKTDDDSFVTAKGTSFIVDGSPFRFVGVNIYDAAATDAYSCDSAARMTSQELENTMRTLHDTYGATVVRFWAYQTYTKSGQDWSGMDNVIRIANDVGIKLIPVLEDGPGYCTTSTDVKAKADYQDDTWFTKGYRSNYGTAPMSFRDYAKIVVEHYRNEKAILGWSLINEADTSARDSAGQSVLVDFATDMGAVVKSADPNHLVTLGTQSNGARGASGPDFTAVYSTPSMDFAEVHDWGYWGSDSEAMPGGTNGKPPAADSAACQQTDALIGCSFAQLPALNKPLFVGEAGIEGGDSDALAARADQLTAKMSAAFAAGAGGYLLWRVTKQQTDKYDILLGDTDPLLPALAKQANGVQ
jgi:mannan endo-1,4-beta-mannosidase